MIHIYPKHIRFCWDGAGLARDEYGSRVFSGQRGEARGQSAEESGIDQRTHMGNLFSPSSPGLHLGHQGLGQTALLTESSSYWPLGALKHMF